MCANGADLLSVALSYLLLIPGQPIIYYGAEQGFNGNCNFSSINAGNGGQHVVEVCNQSGMYHKGKQRVRE